MRIWTFDEAQLQRALRAHTQGVVSGSELEDDILAFLESPAARSEKLFTDMKLRTDVPLSPADIKEPKRGNPTAGMEP